MVHSDLEWRTAQKVVENALQDTNYACRDPERLPGGFINFAFRNKLANPIEGCGQTVVVKMTEDKLKIEKTTGEEFTLHKTRSYYEHHVLTHPLPNFSVEDENNESLSILVRVPKVLDYFPNDYIQIIEDLSNAMTLKAHILQKSFAPQFAATCGKALGAWAAKFHTWGRHPDQENLREVLSGYKEAGIFKHQLSCGRLNATIEKFPEMLGDKRFLFKSVSDRIMTLTEGERGGIIHGDFWPGK
ncbi:hypothetical protein NHQ30_000129 [Ciborinia camelliae]|nr:hypothetical protein NHQ30_000129 [Ciborinia camelliae]